MQSGRLFGRYRLLTLLGRGGMGEVWRAHDTDTDRVVAIKLLHAHLSADPEFQLRFRREAHAAALLNSPHVIPIHHYGEIDGHLYVDMRLVEGRDLGTVLAEGPLEPARAVRVAEQVAKALGAAHDAGLLHRDVKPSNVLLDHDDFAYLIDFGIARLTDETRMTQSGNVIGTFAYIAPERLNPSAHEDARADIYSLTCVLYQSLTGQPPFAGSTSAHLIAAHLTTPPPRPSLLRPDLSARFDEVISTGMAKDPDLRYQSATALAEAAAAALTPAALRDAGSGGDQPPAVPSVRGHRPRPPVVGDPLDATQGAPGAALPIVSYPTTVPKKTTTRRVLAAAAAVVLAGAAAFFTRDLWSPHPDRRPVAPGSGAPASPRSLPAEYGQQQELASSRLAYPTGVAVDIRGSVYVTSTSHDAVYKLADDGGAPIALPFMGLSYPEGLAVDPGGEVYVADTLNHRVLSLKSGAANASALPFDGLGFVHAVAIDQTGRAVYAAVHEPSQVLKLSHDAAKSSVLPFTGLQEPVNVAVDASDDVYVVDKIAGHVIELRSDGVQIQLPFPDLSSPQGLAVDDAGRVYVADTMHNRVLRLDMGAPVPTELPLIGLKYPTSVAVDLSGDVFVVDSPTVDRSRVVELPRQRPR
ncbi:serine/threonine-protein kinase [Mycobacterium sp. MS3]|uniref:serine/threonine-protein kinase n=1 Tax=Mycobacterium sp. MS3 TaxID=3391378 RepID=UPI003989B305